MVSIKVDDIMMDVIFIQASSHLASRCHGRVLGCANEVLAPE